MFFSGLHMEIGESLITQTEEACENLDEKNDTEFLDVNIVMKKENHLFYTDIAVKSCAGNTYQASDNVDDPVGSFLSALPKIDVQIWKKKKAYDRTSRRTGVEINS